MKSFLLTSLLISSLTLFSQSVETNQISKEIDIITDCEIVTLLGNSIELKTVLELNVKPNVGDSAYALVNSVYTNDSGYRAMDQKSFGLTFKESLKQNTVLVKHFTISGDLDYIKNNYKVGESIVVSWKTETMVEHYVEKNEKGKVISEGFYIDGLPVGQETLIDKKTQVKTITHNMLGYKHGLETVFEDGLKISESDWFRGEKNGYSLTWFLNGKISTKIFYIDGTREGHAASYYESGQMKKSIYFYGDKAHGQDYYYSESGKLLDDAQYKNGEYHGVATKYYENGNIRFRDHRVDGVIHGEYMRNYESGAKEVRTNFVEGKLHGSYIDFYENGTKKSKGNFFNGDKVGKWTYWDQDGKKTTESFDKK